VFWLHANKCQLVGVVLQLDATYLFVVAPKTVPKVCAIKLAGVEKTNNGQFGSFLELVGSVVTRLICYFLRVLTLHINVFEFFSKMLFLLMFT
jgi:hypothetical protein